MAKSRAVLLDEYFAAWAGVLFDWSKANCCHYAAGWLSVIEPGSEALQLVLPNGMRSAMELVQSFESLSNAVTHHLGRDPIAPTQAQVGDIVLLPGSFSGALALCNGRNAGALSLEGLVFTPMDMATAVWPTGRVV